MYRFEVAGGRSWVHAELTNLPADFDLEVQTADGDAILGSHNDGTFPEAVDLALDPGTYYLLIHSLVAASNNDQPYQLGLSMVPLGGGERPSGAVLFADNFNAQGAHFPVTATGDGYEVGYYDGEYVVRLHNTGTVAVLERRGQIAPVDWQDFQLDLDARMTALADKDSGFVIGFRFQDGQNFYELYIDTVNGGGPGVAKLARWTNGSLSDLTAWVPSPAIRTGTQTNHVTLLARGDQLAVAVNGQPVLDVRDNTYRKGAFGLAAFTSDRPSEARFDNVLTTAVR
jgi:hypothetical protein